jgi:hypothetical protein
MCQFSEWHLLICWLWWIMCHFFRLTPPYVDSDGLCLSFQNDTSLYVDSDGLCVIFQTDISLYVNSDGLCVILSDWHLLMLILMVYVSVFRMTPRCQSEKMTHKPSESTYKEMSVWKMTHKPSESTYKEVSFWKLRHKPSESTKGGDSLTKWNINNQNKQIRRCQSEKWNINHNSVFKMTPPYMLILMDYVSFFQTDTSLCWFWWFMSQFSEWHFLLCWS